LCIKFCIFIKNIKIMNRKEFFARVGFGAAAVLVPACIVGVVSSCSSDSSDAGSSPGPTPTPPPSGVDFNLDVSTGSLATNGGFLVTNAIIVARTLTGEFLAVSSSCPHEGTNVNYSSSGNNFVCPNHNSQFTNKGVVTQGPAKSNLKEYKTALNGNTLRVFS
jgi:cytochrome b6-f complex iron-sulfur subunit